MTVPRSPVHNRALVFVFRSLVLFQRTRRILQRLDVLPLLRVMVIKEHAIGIAAVAGGAKVMRHTRADHGFDRPAQIDQLRKG